MCSWRQLDLPSGSEDRARDSRAQCRETRPPPRSALGLRTVPGHPKRGEGAALCLETRAALAGSAAGLANQAAPGGGST